MIDEADDRSRPTSELVIEGRKPIEDEGDDPGRFARHFKTQLCNNFYALGLCKYNKKCLFAHGEGDVRSVAQNVADGLVTDKSIRKFQRHQAAMATPKSELGPASLRGSPITSETLSTAKGPPVACSKLGDSGEGADFDPSDDMSDSGARDDPDSSKFFTYRHDPYAFVGQVDKAIAEAVETANQACRM